MKCTNCQYPLWNIESRTCPECGTGFRPSDYDFTLNSVQFVCPGCRQSYYGTGLRGHLVPNEFDCVRCGRHLTMDEMILLPTEGVEEERTRVDFVPWCDPGSTRGPWKRFTAGLATTFMAMTRPDALGWYLPRGSSHISALMLATATNLVYWMIGWGWMFLLAFLGPVLSGATGGRAMLGALLGLLIMLAVIVLGLTIVPIWVWAASTHLILRLTGKTEGSIIDTANAIAFASTANCVTAVPCIGPWVGWVWWIVSAVFTVKGVHRIGGGRASAAVLISAGVWVVAAFAGMFTLMIWGTTMAGAAGTGNAVNTWQPQALTGSLVSAHFEEDAWPEHGLVLLDDTGNVWSTSFLTSWGQGAAGTHAGTPLEQLQTMSVDQRRVWIAKNAQLPPGTVAHRVGDVVFTYHGVDPAADGELWVLVFCPPSGTMAAAEQIFIVGKANGTTEPIDPANVTTRLTAQNGRRASFGLAPIPNPATVAAPLPPADVELLLPPPDSETEPEPESEPAERDPALLPNPDSPPDPTSDDDDASP